MNTSAVKVAVVEGKTITQTSDLPIGKSDKPVRIKAVDNGKYILAEGEKGIAPENITVKRVGQDLHVALEGTDPDQPQLVIEGFFDTQSQLVGVAEDGAYYEYISSDGEQDRSAAFLIEDVASPQVLGSEPLVGFGNGLVAAAGIGWLLPALLGLGALGLIGAAIANDDDDNDDHAPVLTGPATPTLDSAVDNVGDKTGPIENGGVTDDATPTFGGSGTPGNIIVVRDGGKVIGETIVGEDGKWTYTPEPPLTGGSHEIIVVEKDKEGNESDPSPGFEIIIDLTAPAKSVITAAHDDVGDQQGLVAQNGVTDDNTPTLTGTAEAGATVEVYANGVKIGETIAASDGRWSFTANPALADGQYSFTTVAIDAAGNRGLPSDPYVLTVNTQPGDISITGAVDDTGSVTGALGHGDVTDDTTPTLNGLATPNGTVNIYNNGVLIGSAVADASGNWTFTPDPALSEGNHSFTATVINAAGGESAPTPVFNLEIDTTPPPKPGEGTNGGIDTVIDDVGAITGPISNGGSTDDTKPTLGGGGQTPGDKVTIIDNGTEIGEVIVDENGNWTFEPEPALGEGSHEFTVIVTDPAGNRSEPSDPYLVIVDTVAPAQAVITSVVDDQGADTGALVPGEVTDDAQPDINGTAEAGSTVIIYNQGVEIGRAPVAADGTWTFMPVPPLTNGSHELTVAAMDAAGNIGAESAPFDFEVAAGGTPLVPAITGMTDDVDSHVGNLMPGSTTNDARPTVNGTGQPGATINVYADGVLLGTAVVAANGQWSYTPTVDLADGLRNISASATDAVGNVSPQTGDYPITVDTTAPDASTGETLTDDVGAITGPIADGDTTDDNTPTLNGTAEPGSMVIIFDNGVEIGRVPVGADGSWTYVPRTPLIDGPHSFHTVVEDAAGNQSPASTPIDFIVDTSAVLISITQVFTDAIPAAEGVAGKVPANLNPVFNGDVTTDTTPTLNGKANPNSVVNIYDDGVLIGSTRSNASGDWTFTPTTELAEGDHTFTATVVTEAGGESAPTTVFHLEIDLTAPGKAGIDIITDDVGAIQGPIENGGSTDDTTPTLSGSGQTPGDKVTIIDNGNVIGEVIVDAGGNWSFTPNPPLNDGKHDFTLIVTDPAGNSSVPSDPYTVIVDTVAPGQPVITSVVDDQGNVTGPINSGDITDDAQPQINGTAEAGSTVVIYDKGVKIGETKADASGNWSFTPSLPLSNGTHNLTVTAVDAAGNEGTASDPFDFELIAGGVPAAPAITGISDDVGSQTGNVQPGGITDDARPTINGTGQAGATISVFANGVLLGTTVVAENGQWSFTPETDLADGLRNITASAANAAGNVSPTTGEYPITIDTTAPGAATDKELSDDVGAVTGPIENGDVTDDNTPTLSGTAEAGSTVIVYNKGVEIGRVQAGADGNWSFTPSTALPDGAHRFHTVVEDAAGNQGPASTPIDFTVDTRAVEISLDQVRDDAGQIQGALSNGGVTDDATPTLTGKATPNAIVNIYDKGVLIGTAPSDAAGNWTFTPNPGLAEGDHSFTVTVVTEAGGESAPTAAFNLKIDLTSPDTPDEGGNGGIDIITDDVGAIQGPIENGGSTDDTTPTLSGGGQTPGDKVTIIDNGNVIGEVIVGAGGNWSFTPNPPLIDGKHDFTLIVTDPAGNASAESDPYTVIVDTVAPGQPAITSVVDDQGNVTGPINAGDITDDAQPQINGTAEIGSIVIIYDKGVEIGRAPVDASGNWTFTPSLPLGNGTHNLTVTAVDAAGNEGAASDPFDFELIAGGVPAAPAITGISDDVGSQTGNVQPGGITDDARPTINGTGQAGATISVYSNGVLLGTAVVASNGQWSFTPETDLADGLRNITASATNAAGNVSPTTGEYPITIDTTAPGAATDKELNDDVGAVTGPIENGDVTDDNTPTLSGTAEAGSTVIVFNKGVEIGRVQAGADGNWSFTPSTALPDGAHSFHTVVEDAAGNQGPASTPIDFTVDTRAVEISITQVSDDVGTVTGPLSNGGVTDDATPTLSGKATPNATVNIYDKGVLIGNATSDASGNWSFTPTTPLTEGDHSFTATVVTEAGGESTPTAVFNLEVDLTAPVKPGEGGNGGIDLVTDDVGAIQGPIENGGSTDDTTPTLSGGGQAPGDKVTIIDNGNVIGEAIVDAGGNWTFTPDPALNDGQHDFTLIVTDSAGNSSEESEPYTVIVDTLAPGQPVITSVVDDQGNVTGPINSGDITDDAQPQINGTAEIGSTVIIYDKGVKIGETKADASGNWSFTPSLPLSNGTHNLTVTAMDAAGNEGAASDPFDFELIAGGVPAAPAITGISDDVGSQTGNVQPGGITDDARPTINGTGQAGATISVYSNGVLLGTTVVAENGQWSFTPETDLADGLRNITASATNAAGNVSPTTGEYPITIDTTAPGAATDKELSDDVGAVTGPIENGDVTDDNTPTLSGTAEAGSTVIVYNKGVEIGRVQAGADGSWSFTPSTALPDGAHSFHTVVEDAAGNQGPASTPIDFTVDTRAVEISITQVSDDVGTVTGPLSNGGVTDDATPTLSGKATPNATVNIYDKGLLIGSVTSDASGNWSFTPTTPLTEGDHSFTATVVTEAGGESTPTAVFNLEVDLTAPVKPGEGGNGGIDLITDDVGAIQGPIENGGSTDDTTPTLSGGGQTPGDKVTIIDNGNVIGEVIVDAGGNWSFTPDPALNDGQHDFTLIVTDPAGNASEESDPYTVIVDTVAPGQPVITSVVDDQGNVTGPINSGDITDDAQPQINGTAEIGSMVIIYDKGVKIGETKADASGNWSFTPSLPLSNGTHNLTVTAVDAAGNEGAASDPFDFELIAGGVPAAPAITGISDDVGSQTGNVQPGGITDDARPTINGTGQAGATISVFANGVLLGTTVVAENGQWSFTPETDLADGLRNITASATNAAGNVSPTTGEYPITIDTTAPGAATDKELSDDVGAVTGPIENGDVTDDNTPTLSGTAEAGSTVIVFNKGVEIGRVQAGADGNWSFTPSTALPDGAHRFHTVVEDAAGNQGPASTPIDFTVDTRAVEISITQVSDDVGTVTGPLSNGGVTDDATPTLSGKATPNATVNIYDKGVLIGNATSDASGNWSFTPTTPLTEGDHSFTATVVTEAGGESTPTAVFNLEVDLTAPVKPGEGGNGGIDLITDDVGAIQGPIENGGSTDDTTPTLSGSGQTPGDKVTIIDNGNVIGEVIVDAGGNWTFTPDPALNDGQHDFTLIVTDPAGNSSEPSDPYTVIVDTAAPTAQAVVDSMGKDSGSDNGDFVTNNGTAGRLIQGSLTAALAANEKVQVSVDGGATWMDAALNGDGTWSFVDETAHAADWEIQTRVVDAAGNIGVESSQAVALDITPPDAPNSISRIGDVVTVDIAGTNVVAGDTLYVGVGQSQIGHILTLRDIETGVVPVSVAGLDGSVSAFVVDAVGNASAVLSYKSGIYSDFVGEGGGRDIGRNVTLDRGFYKLAVASSETPRLSDGGIGTGNTGVIGGRTVGSFTFSFDEPAGSLSFQLLAVNTQSNLTMEFMDEHGNVIHSEVLPEGKDAPSPIIYYTSALPDGMLFSSAKLVYSDKNGFTLTDLEVETSSLSLDPHPVTQWVMSDNEYFGDEANNIFRVEDVAVLLSGGAKVNGGAGLDTLSFEGGSQILNLTDISEKISSIEVIDLTGSGDNTLKLSLEDVLNNGETDLFHDSGSTQMMIKGNAGDVVDLQGLISAEDPGSWSTQGPLTIGGVTYEVYTHSSLDAELLVQQGVTTNLV